MAKGAPSDPPVPLQATPLALGLTDHQTYGVPHGCSKTLGKRWSPAGRRAQV